MITGLIFLRWHKLHISLSVKCPMERLDSVPVSKVGASVPALRETVQLFFFQFLYIFANISVLVLCRVQLIAETVYILYTFYS